MHGITVVLYERTETGRDGFNSPQYTTTPVEVHNILVSPLSSSEQVEALNLHGKKVVYQLGIPKGDDHTWEDCDVEFFGHRWHVCNFITQGIDGLVPTVWNAKAEVERVD